MILSLESELVDIRDTSMALGRFFSVLEVEAREFATTVKEDLKFHLKKGASQNLNFILSMQGVDNISAVDLTIYSQMLEERIREKLSVVLPKITGDKDDFIAAVDSFVLKPLFAKSASNKEVEKIVSFIDTRRGQYIDFEDIKKICDVAIRTESAEILSPLLDLLERDLVLRSERYNINCKKELYRGSEPSTKLKAENDIKNKLTESIRAILIHQHSILTQQDAMEFLDAKITYDEYLKRQEYNTYMVLNLW